MSRVAYINGAYVALHDARVGIEDRGYQFSDGVYEVWGVFDGVLADAGAHLLRLERSLAMLRIRAPMPLRPLMCVVKEVQRRNRIANGLVYLQATRGVAPRDHAFPSDLTQPTLVVTARSVDRRRQQERAEQGVAVATLPDIRWGRCDIKSISLLPNVLAKQEARERGCYEAWLVDDQGLVTEGASSTAWIINREGALITRPLGADILPGVTRAKLIDLAQKSGVSVVERAFSVAEAQQAVEAFITSASATVMPVTSIDGSAIANGRPGTRTLELRASYLASIGC